MSAKGSSHGAAGKHAPVDKSAEVRTYLIIFASLAVLTLDDGRRRVPEPAARGGRRDRAGDRRDQGLLIASFFMHLRGEGHLINYSVAVCCVPCSS